MFSLIATAGLEINGTALPVQQLQINAKNALKTGTAYAQYIVFGGNSGRVCVEAQRGAYNTDIAKGKLTARYGASIGSDEYNGQMFSYFGLSSDGEELLFETAMPEREKRAGEEISVSLTVSVEFESDSKPIFCGGDNPLAGFLLGRNGLGTNVGFFAGDCNRKNANAHIVYGNRSISDAQLSFDENGFSFSATVPSTACEVVFTLDSTPVLRYFIYEGMIAVRTLTTGINSDKSVHIPFEYVENIVSCTQNGIMLSLPSMVRCFNKLYKVNGLADFNAGHGASFKSDKFNEYAALLSGGEILFFRPSSEGIALTGRVKTDAVEIAVCAGGAVAAFGNTLCMYDPDTLEKREYSIGCGEQNVIVNEGNLFHYLKYENGYLYRYRIYPHGAEEIQGVSITPPVSLCDVFYNAAIVSSSACYYLNSTTAGYSQNSALRNLYTRFGSVKSMQIGDGFAHISLTDDSASDKIAAMEGGAYLDIGKDTKVTIFGALMLLENSGRKYLVLFNRGKRSLDVIEGDLDAEEISSVCVLGEHLLVLDTSGRVGVYYCNKNGAYAYNPSLATDKLTNLLLRLVENTLQTNSTKITARINYGSV